jgi:hypothetical protein
MGRSLHRACCSAGFFLSPPPIVLGEGAGGGLQAVLNLCENRLHLLQHFPIREAQHSIPELRQPRAARLILRAALQMMSAVNLHDEHSLHAAEVNDVWPDGVLAAEVNAKLMPPQTHPEFALGVGLLAAQPPRAVAWENRRAHR